jgi:PQQ system protein
MQGATRRLCSKHRYSDGEKHGNSSVITWQQGDYRLFAHGGLTRATLDADGIMRDQIRIPVNGYIWKPAIVVMPQGGILELDVTNDRFRHPLQPSDL